jgi:transposase
MAYEAAFRKRVIEYKDTGHTFKEAYEIFGVDSKRYYSWKKQLGRTGSLECQAPKERSGKTDRKELMRPLDEYPDRYLREFAEQFNVWPRAIHKMLKRLGVAYKKTFAHSKKSEEEREAFLERIAGIPKKSAYTPECGMHGYPQREYGRALRGVKAEDTKRGNSFHRINAVAAVTHGRDGTKKLAPECYNGSMAGGRL